MSGREARVRFSPRRPSLRLLAPLIALVSLLGACAPKPPLRVERAWMRPVAAGGTTAGYLVVINDTSEPVQLIGAMAAWCEGAEIHETRHEGPRTAMREVPWIPVPARGRFTFAPGKHHLMFVRTRFALTAGTTLHGVFELATGDTLGFDAVVKR